jgi:hypothetical protein
MLLFFSSSIFFSSRKAGLILYVKCVQELKVDKLKKDGTQWFDVGIIKGTTTVVSHYHLPSENQGNGDVSIFIIHLFYSFFFNNHS